MSTSKQRHGSETPSKAKQSKAMTFQGAAGNRYAKHIKAKTKRGMAVHGRSHQSKDMAVRRQAKQSKAMTRRSGATRSTSKQRQRQSGKRYAKHIKAKTAHGAPMRCEAWHGKAKQRQRKRIDLPEETNQ